MTGGTEIARTPLWTEIDGVPTVWAEAPGPLAARLMFRVGKTDESLPVSGITHLAEHLALHRLGQQPHYQNGSVHTSITTFDVSGDADTVVRVIADLCRAFDDLPTDRLTEEIRVLEAESGRRAPSAYTAALGWRFGPRGPGLWNYDEFVGRTVDGVAVQAWASEVFTRDNAMLVLSGAPPAGLAMPLSPGVRRPVPPLTDALGVSPAWFHHGFPDVAAVGQVDRSMASVAFVHALQHELARRLRYERGVAYSPSADYDPYDGTTALVAVMADAHPDHLETVAAEVSDVLEELATSGPASKVLDDFRTRRLEQARLPGEAAARAHMVAFDRLVAWPVTHPSWEDELDALSVDDVAEAARQIRGSLLYALPAGVKLPGFRALPAPEWSTAPPVAGNVFYPYDWSGARLVLGVDGITLDTGQPGKTATVRFHECCATLAWPDGKRVLIAPDAMAVTVEPHLWAGGGDIVRYIDERTSAVRVPQRPRPTDDIPPEPPLAARVPAPGVRPARVAVASGVTSFLIGLAAMAPPASEGGVAIGRLLSLAGALSVVVGARRLRRIRRAQESSST